MFDEWAKVMGGILDVAGIGGFLGNLEQFYEDSDAEGKGWRMFVAAWWNDFGDSEKGVADLLPLAGDLNLGDGKERSQQTRLGIQLRNNRDRVFELQDGQRLRVERGGEVRGAAQFRLRRLSVACEPQEPREPSPRGSHGKEI